MPRRRKILRNLFLGRKGFKLWPLILIITLFYYLGFNPFSEDSSEKIEYYSSELYSFLILAALFSLVFYILYFLYSVVNKSPISDDINSNSLEFNITPIKFSKSIIQLTARVEVYFPDPIDIRIKKFGINLFRNLTKQENHIGRYYHQRFLISSPLLKANERIMVFHNTNFGWLKLASGDWINLRGEYLHLTNQNQSNKKNHFYGKIHYTHEPLGFIKKFLYFMRKKILRGTVF